MTTSTALTAPSPLKTFLDVYRAPASVLAGVMRDGEAPPFEELLGWEFNGLNVGFGPGLIGIRKFRKGFFDGPALSAEGPSPFIQGYNIPVRQNGAEKPHIAKPSDEKPKRFGFYRVYSAQQNARFNRYPKSLLLDYGLGGNGFAVPALLRDYLVQVHAGSSELLLGYAVFALGPLTIPGGFFVLERTRRHDFKGK